jgi:hypothetical protein
MDSFEALQLLSKMMMTTAHAKKAWLWVKDFL